MKKVVFGMVYSAGAYRNKLTGADESSLSYGAFFDGDYYLFPGSALDMAPPARIAKDVISGALDKSKAPKKLPLQFTPVHTVELEPLPSNVVPFKKRD